jgi:mono/diheme cytochrome c family protein
MTRVKAAAGRVASDEYGKGEGLYRQHCVHCHGITGNGKGPTATFLNPYPRDFTAGIFKFDSTPIGYKPTHEDLRRVIMEGIAGTAMPSFKLLSEGEVEALIDYVKFLSIRGETERKLLEQIGEFVPGEQDDATAVEKLRTDFQSRELLVDGVLTEVIESWNAAKDNVTEIPVRPATYDRFSPGFDETALQASEERGRKLYYTNVANCYSCHGPSQLGDGQVTDYDKWTKEFYDWTKKTEKDYPERLAEYEARGGLPLRNILPRNLRDGIYRGGRRPIDIFWRVHNGIDGTPMPAANKQALQDSDIWDIVNYVLSLPYEPVSRPGLDTLTNDRGVR